MRASTHSVCSLKIFTRIRPDLFSRRKILPCAAAPGAGGLGFVTPHVARAAKRTSRLASVLPHTSPAGQMAHAFAKALAEKSEGCLALDLNLDTAASAPVDMAKGVQEGSIDIIIGNELMDALKATGNEISMTDMPNLFRDRQQAREALDGKLGKLFGEIFQTYKLTALGWCENGVRHITANRPIRSAADLQSLKLRVPGIKVMLESFRAMGAAADPLPLGQLKEALRIGKFDAQENPIGNIVGGRFFEVQSHLSLTGHIYSLQHVVMSPEILAELSAADRTALNEAAKIGIRVSREANDRIDSEGLGLLRQQGMTIVDNIDHASMRKAGEKAVARIAELYGPGPISRVRALLG